MGVSGTLNLELNIPIKNLKELLEKTSMLAKALTADSLENMTPKPASNAGESASRFVTQTTVQQPRSTTDNDNNTTTSTGRPFSELTSEFMEYFNAVREGQAVSFNAEVIRFDDTFRSQGTDTIWGLLFTSKDIMDCKNLATYLRKNQNIRITISKVKEGKV